MYSIYYDDYDFYSDAQYANIDDECAWIDDGERTTVVYFN